MSKRPASSTGPAQDKTAGAPSPESRPRSVTSATKKEDARLRVDVQWADITKADGDAFVVGHYMGVLPQNAELVLDCALSGEPREGAEPPGTVDASKLVLTDLTKRGSIRGSLGDVTFFPWQRRQIVLAGMGGLGTFREPQLRTLARTVVQMLGRVLEGSTICTVLIGSGYGNLTVSEAVWGLLAGACEALAANPTLEIGTLRIVEFRIDRAYEIVRFAQKAAARLGKAWKEKGVTIHVEGEVIDRHGAGGVIPIPFGFSWMLALLAQACHEGPNSALRPSLDALVEQLPPDLRAGVRAALGQVGDETDPRRLGSSAFKLDNERPQETSEVADRVSFLHDGTWLQSAAITNMTTVAARDLDVPLEWVDRIVDDLFAPPQDVAQTLAPDAFRRLVHPELRQPLLASNPLVLEVDRSMVRVPWEMLYDGSDGGSPIGIARPVARQLRTSYSARPADVIARRTPRALVIGDPDDSLACAREEARAVAAILEGHFDVELRLGSADELRLGRIKGIRPADLYDIVGLLQGGEFDLVHYCGHAKFDPEYPDRSGWLFRVRLLTPSKLEGVDRAPRLIFANACVSAGVSRVVADAGAAAGGEPAAQSRPRGDSRLVASLADEFFRRGVADYIGTAWEVPELPAKLFAERFYSEIVSDRKMPIGAAVQAARKSLYDQRREWKDHGSVWAAYQHYGDPTRRMFE